MKRRFLLLLTFAMLILVTSAASTPESKFDPTGKWKFSAPDAPYGYNTGTIEVKLSDKDYSATLSFEGMDYKFIGEVVTFKDDVLTFNIYLEGDDIILRMTIEEEEKMVGKAVTLDGEIQISAKKIKE